MKTQFDTLAEIKKIEEKITRLHSDATRLPEEIRKIESALAQKKTELGSVKALFDSDEKSLRRMELDLKEKEESLRKAEGKMSEVKTNEEYQAALKENEGYKKEKAQLEERVLGLLSQFETKKQNIKNSEKEFSDLETTLGGDIKALETGRTKILRQIEEQTAARSENLKRLTPDLANQYQRISKGSADTSALAYVDNGMCMECSLKVRPQLYNEIIGQKAFHRCSNCGKLLILKPNSQDPA